MKNLTLTKSKIIALRQRLLEIHQKVSWDKQWPPRDKIALQDFPTAQKVFDAEKLIVPESRLISSNAEKVLEAKIFHCPEAWAARIPNGAGVGGTVLTEDNKAIIPSLEGWNHYGPPNNWLVPISQKNSPLEGSCLDLGQLIYASNYFHALVDQLPKLAILRTAGWEPDWILLPKKRSRVIDAIYQRIGLEKKIIYTSVRELRKASEMFACSWPNQNIGKYESWGIKFLNQLFNPKIEEQKIKVFIDRSGSAGRRIKNQDEIEKRLTKLGFIKVRLEERTIEEQVNIFHNAEVIIAPHGAGLANLAFCQPNTKVIEIFSPKYVLMTYRQLAARLELPWLGIVGEGEMADMGITKRNIFNRRPNIQEDITLEPKVLDKALDWAFPN